VICMDRVLKCCSGLRICILLGNDVDITSSSSLSSSLHGLGESSVQTSSVVVSLSVFFFVYLFLVSQMVDIYMLVVECAYVPLFVDVLSPFIPVLYYFFT
jgi:hypothetical protein